MPEGKTTLTPQDADDALLLQLTLDQVDQYLDGDEMDDVLSGFADAVVEVRRRTSTTKRRHFLMLEVVP